jgi:hypothetical protein
MPIMADVIQEKQKISAQLAKVDAERSRLQDRLAELEVAERVLSRFGRKGRTQKRGGRVAEPQSEEPAAIGQGSASHGNAATSCAPRRSIAASRRGDFACRESSLTRHLGRASQRLSCEAFRADCQAQPSRNGSPTPPAGWPP